MKVTGVMIYYYFICKKRLWYFSNGINMEQNSELVEIGKIIDESSYSRNKKHFLIDDTINIDFLDDWKIIHEIKKSDKLEIASKWQIKYYIYILRQKGIYIEKGILDYPTLRKRKDVYLEKEDIEKLKDILIEIEKISKEKKPFKVKKIGYCKQCSYYDLCFI